MLLSQISLRERRWDLELDQEMENRKKMGRGQKKKCANGSSLATQISQHACPLGLAGLQELIRRRRPPAAAAGRRPPPSDHFIPILIG
jgi:hypothetical protein